MGKKFIFRHMKVPCKSSCAGGALPRTDALIGPAAYGQCPKPDSLKRRACVRAPSLESLNSLELLEATLSQPLDARLETNHLKKSRTVPKP